MPAVAVHLTIGDYNKWRLAFEKGKPFRDKAGYTNVSVYRNADNKNAVIVWGEVPNVDRLREMFAGPDLKKTMQEAGVVGPPRLHVVV